MSNGFITLDWLREHTTGVTVEKGAKVTLAVVTQYEIGDVDPTTGAVALHRVGASGKASKNGRPVKDRGVQQVVRVVASPL